ncbi:hypothetical protein VTK56DRAFT_9829 [Thermocarpiscus australiensis]
MELALLGPLQNRQTGSTIMFYKESNVTIAHLGFTNEPDPNANLTDVGHHLLRLGRLERAKRAMLGSLYSSQPGSPMSRAADLQGTWTSAWHHGGGGGGTGEGLDRGQTMRAAPAASNMVHIINDNNSGRVQVNRPSDWGRWASGAGSSGLDQPRKRGWAWVTDNTHDIGELEATISDGVASANIPSHLDGDRGVVSPEREQ